MNMSKNEQKQKRGIYYSIAVIALGCIISSIYSNGGMKTAGEYQIDLSKLDDVVDQPKQTNEQLNTTAANDEVLKNAGVAQDLAKVSGRSVVNPMPSGQEIAKNEKEKVLQRIEADEDLRVIRESDKQLAPDEDTLKQLSFAVEDGLGWPLVGDVILGYSMDKSIFFETLQQYRYNPGIYISANEGDVVNACAKGIVTEIGQDTILGTYVRTNLGDGYEVTYGQLKDLQVKENDVVARGQVIGSVAQSTIYFTKEGEHVYLEIEKDGKPINPMNMLK